MTRKKIRLLLIGFLFTSCLFLLSCSTYLTVHQRIALANSLAANSGFSPSVIHTPDFSISSHHSKPEVSHSTFLHVYVEGDGFSWVNEHQPSFDPTPLEPTALKLALKDAHTAVVYLARPCQYVMALNKDTCSQAIWTEARFSEAVVHATNNAIDQFKKIFKASRIRLFSYSGGAAVAALVAARREDVDLFVSVAGNLDHKAWTTLHKLDPLSLSLNPANYANQLQHLPQVHFTGSKDTNTPISIAQAYQERFLNQENIRIIEIEGFSHNCCWVARWEELLDTVLLLPRSGAPTI